VVAAALAGRQQGKRVVEGGEVAVGERVQSEAGKTGVVPPGDPALVGQANRALATRGARWRFGAAGTPGPVATASLAGVSGIPVARRYRLEDIGDGERGSGVGGVVIASVNGEPWLVADGDVLLLGSRLDTAWTALPASPAFVPFVDALVNRLARGEAPISEVEGAPRVEFRMRGADTVGATVYGLDPRESDLTPASPLLVHDVLRADVLDGAAFAAARFAGAGRRDGSGLLLVLALLCAVVELGVATRTR